MSYEQSQADAAAANQRSSDTSEYTRLENDVVNLVNLVQAWHTDGQSLSSASTNQPGDTNDLNALRTSLQSQIDAILSVAFTQ